MRGRALTERERLEMLLREYDERMKYNKFQNFWFPDVGQDDLDDPTSSWSRHLYPKHLEFMAAGAKYKQRLFSSANRSGKTVTGCYELVAHLTGLYPDWWEGHRFPYPITAWCVGQTSETTIKILQTELLGPVGEFGTGMVPKHLIDAATLPTVTKIGGGVSGFKVKHASGGYSSCHMKSQEQGVLSFVGTSIDFVFADEPLKEDIYAELITRLAAREGLFINTATPILGVTPFLTTFCDGEFKVGEIDKFKFVSSVTFDDVPHLSAETKEQLLSSYPAYQRACRSTGVPMLGIGAVFPFSAEQVSVEDFEIPPHWPRVYGLDVGWRATARIGLATNPETGISYLCSDYVQGGLTPAEHCRNFGESSSLPHAIDPAAHGRGQADGAVIFDQFQEVGLNLHDAVNAREAGLLAMHEGFRNGTLKAFRSACKDLISELLNLGRDEKGKVKDASSKHRSDAARYAVMSKDKAAPLSQKVVATPDRFVPGPRRW